VDRYYGTIAIGGCDSGGGEEVHQNFLEEKNSSGFFDCEGLVSKNPSGSLPVSPHVP